MMPISAAPATLIEMTGQVFIIAHKENTARLERALLEQGFKVDCCRALKIDQINGVLLTEN